MQSNHDDGALADGRAERGGRRRDCDAFALLTLLDDRARRLADGALAEELLHGGQAPAASRARATGARDIGAGLAPRGGFAQLAVGDPVAVADDHGSGGGALGPTSESYATENQSQVQHPEFRPRADANWRPLGVVPLSGGRGLGMGRVARGRAESAFAGP